MHAYLAAERGGRLGSSLCGRKRRERCFKRNAGTPNRRPKMRCPVIKEGKEDNADFFVDEDSFARRGQERKNRGGYSKSFVSDRGSGKEGVFALHGQIRHNCWCLREKGANRETSTSVAMSGLMSGKNAEKKRKGFNWASRRISLSKKGREICSQDCTWKEGRGKSLTCTEVEVYLWGKRKKTKPQPDCLKGRSLREEKERQEKETLLYQTPPIILEKGGE